MTDLYEILCSVGVIQWLQELFPGLDEDVLLQRIHSDFSALLEDLCGGDKPKAKGAISE